MVFLLRKSLNGGFTQRCHSWTYGLVGYMAATAIGSKYSTLCVHVALIESL